MELKQLEGQMLEMEKSLTTLRATAVEENRPVHTPHTPAPCTRLPGPYVVWRRGRSLASGAPCPGRAPRTPGVSSVHRARLGPWTAPPIRAPAYRATVYPPRAPAPPQIIKKNCTFDSNRLAKIQRWIDTIHRDERRTW